MKGHTYGHILHFIETTKPKLCSLVLFALLTDFLLTCATVFQLVPY